MSELDLTAFYGQFRDEAWENLNFLEQGLTALEAQPDDTALLDRMLRAIHTTKGSAKIMGFTDINQLAHEMEEVLGAIRKGEISLTPEVGNTLIQASSAIRSLTTARIEGSSEPVNVAGLVGAMQHVLGVEERAAEAAPTVTIAATPVSRAQETMRVSLEHIDQLARLVGETLTLHEESHKEQDTLYDIEQTQHTLDRELESLRGRLLEYQNRFRPRQAEEVFERLSWVESTVRQLAGQRRDFARTHSVLLDRFSLLFEELYQHSLAIRMVPIGTLFEVFPGVVRRMAGECGVEVALEVRGAEVELDRRVLDLLREPLIHLVRNALAHGIEPPERRVKAGKSRRGQLALEAEQLGRRVLVRVRDDGRGIDLSKVRRTAIERGWLDKEQAREADEQALLDILFRPTFSTRRKADDMSGRGVGLDVVQATMRQLNGLVQVQTKAGHGTAFVLDVPLTLATIRVLMIEAAGQTMAIPAATIRGLARVRPEEVVRLEGRPILYWQDHPLPLVALATSLGLAASATIAQPTPAVIVGTNGHHVAMTVDRLVDETEVVVRPLGEILGLSPYFSAATLSGDGRVIPILDLAGLLTARPALPSAAAPQAITVQPQEAALVLLVEDAITTRELERSILEAAGYRVETAIDGLDALQKLERHDIDIIITDIEMPRMDGFELTTRVRQEARWSEIPVVIVTAREDDQSRRRGLQTGAQAYIVKSRFDQSNLLETIDHLVG